MHVQVEIVQAAIEQGVVAGSVLEDVVIASIEIGTFRYILHMYIYEYI
jgi:hypothetical protein